jgi:hypothetical protein
MITQEVVVVRGRVELPTFRFSVGHLPNPDLCCFCVGTEDHENLAFACLTDLGADPTGDCGPPIGASATR